MLISEAFPSEFLKAADLHDRQVSVVMDHVEIRDVGDATKPVLFFRGKSKGLVLNKVNSNNIALVYGDETDDWAGQELLIYPTMVDFQGRSVPAIRVKAPKVRPRQPHNDFEDEAEHAPRNAVSRPGTPERIHERQQEYAPRNGASRPGPRATTMTTAQEMQDEVPF